MALENPSRRKKHDFSSSEDEVPNSTIQPPAKQTRRRVGLVSDTFRRRLSFSESPPASEKKQQTAKKNTPRKFKKSKAADRLDDSGISSTATSPASPEAYSQYRWRQLSPELTCSSDSDVPRATASLKNRRGCVGQKRGRKAAGNAADSTPLRGGKRKKTESVVVKKPARGPGKRKQEKTTETSESPARKVTRQTSSRRGQRSRSLENEKEQDEFKLQIVNEEPLDGRAWGETAEDRIQREHKLQEEARRRSNDEFLSKMNVDDDEGSQDKISDLSDLDMDLEAGLHL